MYAVFKVRYRLTHLTSRLNSHKPVGLSGLEPPTSRLSGVRSNQLSYKPIRKLRYLPSTKFSYASLRFGKRLALNSIFAWQLDFIKLLSAWRWRDSNSRPPACKAGALPTELHPHLIWRPPALPHRLQCSTIGRLRLNRRVRDGNGCFPQAHRHQKSLSYKVLLDNSTVKHIQFFTYLP